MSSEDQMSAAQLYGKSERPEADEDARTESSEGSNSKEQWAPEALDSEDEFEDAVEPPPSASGMLLAFDGAMPPLSGAYEDAVEATPEQIAAALESTSSHGSGGGRHSMILEEDEASETEDLRVDEQVAAAVEEIVESTAAAEEPVAAAEPTDAAVIADEQIDAAADSVVAEESGDGEGNEQAAEEAEEVGLRLR